MLLSLCFTLLNLGVVSALATSRQIQLGSDHYFLSPDEVATFESWNAELLSGSDDLIPFTVMQLNDEPSIESLQNTLEEFGTVDDVWQPLFAEALYILHDSDDELADVERTWAEDLAPDYEVSTILGSSDVRANATLPSGPYFVHRYTGKIFQVYKLYVDSSQAFVQSSYQDARGEHHTLPAAIPADAALTIAVPSRLYFTPSDDKPLAGVRVSVKDNYDLRGLKTGGGNRALYGMRDVKTKTATAVQRLIDAGAVIVGKNKLAEFNFGPHYHTVHFDYLLPFNPRGDGYNSPGASSSGSAAAIASYDWLDVSLASDTGGSVRGPAFYNGVYGNRPTQGAVGLDGVLPLSTSMDTAGTLARDPQLWSRVNKALYSNLTEDFTSYPKSVFIDPQTSDLLQDMEVSYPEVFAAAQGFIDAVADHISADISVLNIDDIWADSAPAELHGLGSLDTVVQSVYINLTFYEQWHEFGKGFVEEYMDANDGRFPYMVWSTRRYWLYTDGNITDEMHDISLEMKSQVTEWTEAEVLKQDQETCSGSILLYFLPPWSSYTYKPDVSRDIDNPFIANLIAQAQGGDSGSPPSNDTIKPPSVPVHPTRLASIADLPDYTVTLGSFDLGERTLSNATMQTQALPFNVNIIAARGCDFMILDLIEELHEQGIIKTAKTGMLV